MSDDEEPVRFDLRQAEVQTALDDAERVWETREPPPPPEPRPEPTPGVEDDA